MGTFKLRTYYDTKKCYRSKTVWGYAGTVDGSRHSGLSGLEAGQSGFWRCLHVQKSLIMAIANLSVVSNYSRRYEQKLKLNKKIG